MAYHYDVGYEVRNLVAVVVEKFEEIAAELREEIEDIKSDKGNAELEYDGKYYLRDDVVDRLSDLEHCHRDCEKMRKDLVYYYLNSYD